MSQNISIKINLRQLKSHIMPMKGKDGMINCIVIPIAENSLFVGEKGVYLDMQAWEIKEKKADRKQTHIIKQSYPKEIFDQLSDAQKQAIPIIGDCILWGGVSEPAPNEFEVSQPEAIPGEPEEDDLPF